jgi:hypothetical protein
VTIITGIAMTPEEYLAESQTTTHATLRADTLLLTRRLRDLHKVMVDVETQYFGNVGSALEHLQLLTSHPHFAWLQKLSSLMAEVDERLDQPEPLLPEQALAFRTAIEGLIGPGAETDAQFRGKYLALLHDAPEMAMAHGAVRAALAKLPAPQASAPPAIPGPAVTDPAIGDPASPA